MTPDQSQGKPRSRKIYVLWSIALTLLLAAALFCWLVVVPVWQVRTVLAEGNITVGKDSRGPAAVRQLGGPEATAQRLRSYLRLPVRFASDRPNAVALAYWCGEPGRAIIFAALRDQDEDVQATAMAFMGGFL